MLVGCALPFMGCGPQFGPAFRTVGEIPQDGSLLLLYGAADVPGAEVCVVEVASAGGGVAVELLPGGYYRFETRPGPLEVFVQAPESGAMQTGPSFELAPGDAAFVKCEATPTSAEASAVEGATAERELASRRALPADRAQRIGQ